MIATINYLLQLFQYLLINQSQKWLIMVITNPLTRVVGVETNMLGKHMKMVSIASARTTLEYHNSDFMTDTSDLVDKFKDIKFRDEDRERQADLNRTARDMNSRGPNSSAGPRGKTSWLFLISTEMLILEYSPEISTQLSRSL